MDDSYTTLWPINCHSSCWFNLLTLPLLCCLSYHFRKRGPHLCMYNGLVTFREEEQRSQFARCIFLMCDTKYVEESSGNLGAQEERSPVGLNERYLLLLPITPQSPALSTCKMTLDMPVLMVFYRWRLCFSVMRPRGAGGLHSLPLSHQLTERIHRFDGAKLILSRVTGVLSLSVSVDSGRRKLAAMFVPSWAWVRGWRVNRGTVPVSANVLAWQQKGRVVAARGDSDTVPTPLWLRTSLHCAQSPLWDQTQRPTQLEMAGDIHTPWLACSDTFLPCVSQEPTS